MSESTRLDRATLSERAHIVNHEPGTTNQEHGTRTALPRITVVTPSFNQGRFLEATIRSVLDQAYPDLDYLVIDGGSTDHSVEIIKSHASRLSHWESATDAGQAEAINKGLRCATGEILAYLNSDDEYEPGALQRVGAWFAAHPETDLVYGHYSYVNETGAVLQRHVAPRLDLARLALGNFLSQPTVFMRRRVLDQLGPFDESLHCVLDYDYWLRAALRGFRFDRLDAAQARMRMHADAKTATVDERFWAETLLVFDRLFAQPGVPDRLEAVKARAYARVHWQAALALARAGRDAEAREEAGRAQARFDVLQNMEDLDFVIQRLLYSRDGRLLGPGVLNARVLSLGFEREDFQRLAQIVDEEYVAHLRRRVGGMRRGHALRVLARAVLARPQRVFDWGMRRAFFEALASKR